jgi:hypothetical protein
MPRSEQIVDGLGRYGYICLTEVSGSDVSGNNGASCRMMEHVDDRKEKKKTTVTGQCKMDCMSRMDTNRFGVS